MQISYNLASYSTDGNLLNTRISYITNWNLQGTKIRSPTTAKYDLRPCKNDIGFQTIASVQIHPIKTISKQTKMNLYCSFLDNLNWTFTISLIIIS